MKRPLAILAVFWHLSYVPGCVVQTDTIQGLPGKDGLAGISPFAMSADGDIHYDGGRVGIGTVEPESLLHVYQDVDVSPTETGYRGRGYLSVEAFARSNATNYDPFNTAPTVLLSVVGGENDLSKASTIALSQFNAVSTISTVYTATSRSSLAFATSRGDTNASYGVPVEAMRITDGGRVGIGTMSPSETLDVAGSIGVRGPEGVGARVNLHGQAGVSGAEAGYSATMYMYEQGATTPNHEVAFVRAGLWDNPATEQPETSIGSLEFSTKTSDSWVSTMYLRDGNVGINTSSPAATLDVSGTARLAKYSSPPFPCDTAHDGTIALTGQTKLCICNGSAWLLAAGDTPCW